MEQVREVLRAWLSGVGQRPAARQAGVDRKTAARYIGEPRIFRWLQHAHEARAAARRQLRQDHP